MDEKRFEQIKLIAAVLNGCLWSLEEKELDLLYKKSEIFSNEQKEKSKEFAHMIIEKLFEQSL